MPHGDRSRRAAAAVAGVPELRAELHLRRHLLEQPPPHVPRRASGSTAAMLWANLHLLFWLSLIPFVTGWMGENHFASMPTAIYGVVLLMSRRRVLHPRSARLLRRHGPTRRSSTALRDVRRGRSPSSHTQAVIALAFVNPWVAQAIYVGVAIMWLIPDRRVERTLAESPMSD